MKKRGAERGAAPHLQTQCSRMMGLVGICMFLEASLHGFKSTGGGGGGGVQAFSIRSGQDMRMR